jgi:hypothetical protein
MRVFREGGRKASTFASFLLAFSVLGAAVGVTAGAAPPEPLFRIPEDIAPGSGAGELSGSRAVAANADNGHIYVADSFNARVSEFTAWGSFVKAWGWDVAPGAVDEEQEFRVRAAAGQFRLTFGALTTADLAFDAPSSEVESALNALPAIGLGGVSVSGGPGSATGTAPYLVSFDGGTLAGGDVAQITASNGAMPLSGGTPFSGVEVSTRANGTSGGTGLESCTTGSGCKAGSEGNASGQFAGVDGLAVDAAGDIYAFDRTNQKVQKFNPAGEYLLTFGSAGAGDGQFEASAFTDYLTYNPAADSIFVGDKGRIQEFGTNGAFKSKILFDGAELGKFAGQTVCALDADASGNLYFALCESGHVHKVNTSGEFVAPGSFEPVVNPNGVAVDPFGTVWAIADEIEAIGFDAPGTPIAGAEPGDKFAKSEFPGEFAPKDLRGLATNLCAGSGAPGNLYVARFRFSDPQRSYLSVYGTGPVGCEAPPKVPPEIAEQYATWVGTREATVKAEINPHFWTDATYYVEYGTGECAKGGCQAVPAPPGAKLTSKAGSAPVRTAAVFLAGLQPGVTYHYRFVAQSGGGGPVLGEYRTFRTFPLPEAPPPCPNDEQRTGPSARLADCRAYEMVSPLDKNNADIVVPRTILGFPNDQSQSAASGDALTYSAGRAFGAPGSAPYVSQYLARRGNGGWASEAISPPRMRLVASTLDPALEGEYQLFSANLCDGWLRTAYDPPLAAGAIEGFQNLYRRDNCAGGYETLTTAEPPHHIPSGYGDDLRVLGASADGSRTIFYAPDSLTAEAPANENGRRQLYVYTEGVGLRFVCILPSPSGTATNRACYPGTVGKDELGLIERSGSFHEAISEDGSRIFWTEAPAGAVGGPGRVFVLVEGEAASRRVSQTVSGAKAHFWGAAEDGSKAVFSIEDGASPLDGNLYSFDLQTDAAALIGEGFKGMLGMSEDASRVYFASTKELGGGASSEGDLPKEGQPNLYFYEEGEGVSFIGTLADNDVDGGALNAPPTPISPQPSRRSSRVSPSGRHAAFTSHAQLTGYDNTDVASGEPDAEVFLYDADSDVLGCVSCNPTRARPRGRRMQSLSDLETEAWAAAEIPMSERPLYYSRALSEDGRRLFFESHEALMPTDTNGVQDVYQWEAPGKGSCDAGDPTFNTDPGGCVELVSSGESAKDSSFVDADPSGQNIFFTTLASLVPPDYGLVDLYDARVEGGFSYSRPKPPCEGEACQSPPAAPQDPTPASAAGATESKPRHRCPKGKRRVVRGGKARCVKKGTKGKQARRAGRAGR